jgi:hypothetical protein
MKLIGDSTPHLIRNRHSTLPRQGCGRSGRKGAAPTVKAAVEVSVLLRSVRKLRREEGRV